ncbi:MAG: hypothetical protein JNK15_17630 [Planctomycetes bacterium]|nr:hypothetical protein [Planctomycetota bacterium]
MNPTCPAVRVAIALLGCTPSAFAQLPNYTAAPGTTVLNTVFTQITTSAGPMNVADGVFVFNQVTIPVGSVVVGSGSRPMIWVVNTMTIDGHLSADGKDGMRVQTIGSANFPVLGGLPGPAGGLGGAGSPRSTTQSFQGQAGYGPGNVAGAGGGGGSLALLAGSERGSGGGGGAFGTQGDPWFRTPAGTGTAFVQRLGVGGFGGLGASGSATRTLLGGAPALTPFGDGRPDNDFFGLGYDVASQQFVVGELSGLLGGSGGGGGGDASNDNIVLSPNFVQDDQGGGGGGGGGCLVVYALQTIVVGPGGKVTANGGHGGGGGLAGSNTRGGGGGGGAGGLLILAAHGGIDLHVKGETYANADYDFVLSADGGVTTTGFFSPPLVTGKYPANGLPTVAANVYDSAPLGGFGGLGVVQLVTPAGVGNADGTNTILDDNIRLFRNGLPLLGAQKQRYLAWRGFANANGVRVDDSGTPIVIGNAEGDIRPTPHLLPLF